MLDNSEIWILNITLYYNWRKINMNYGVLGLVTGETDGIGKNSFAKKLLS